MMQGERELWRTIQGHVGMPEAHRDGRPGPMTAGAIARFLDLEEEPAATIRWPKDEDGALVRYYGEPGSNQVRLELPYPMVLSWDETKRVESFFCHAQVHDALRAIYTDALAELGMGRIEELGLHRFSGCLNVRRKRGGSSWSVHAFGAAVDHDDARNKLRWGRDRARLGQRDAETWWEIVEHHGGVSLGREQNRDWMHFQFARL